MGKLVAGVGINDADYAVVRFSDPDENGRRKQVFRCPYYFRWHGMLTRCFNKGKSNYKQYEKTTVCEEWMTFSNFKRWMEGCDWEGKVLDKDLRGDSTLYSPETCSWIPHSLNSFIEDVSSSKDYPIPGVFITNRYDVDKNFKDYRGTESFETIEDAIDGYCNFKFKIASEHYEDHYDAILDLYSRRKQHWLKFVDDNRALFPVLDRPIRHASIPKVGDRFQTNKGYWYTVKEYRSTGKVIIEFDTGEVKSVHNCRIKTGVIRCKSGKHIKDCEKVMKRVDKYFKLNKHGLLVGITPCGKERYGVSCMRTILYYPTLDEAIRARKEKVMDIGVRGIIETNPTYKEEIEEYYNCLLKRFDLL